MAGIRASTKPGYYDATAGKVHTGTRMKSGSNVGWSDYSNTCKPWINLIHGVGQNQLTGGWLDNTTGFSQYFVNVRDYFDPGTYVIEWDGDESLTLSDNGPNPGWTLTFDGRPSVNRREYTTANSNGHRIIGINVPQGNQVTNIKFYDKTQENDLKVNGYYLHSEFIQDMSTHDIIRVKDMQTTDESHHEDWSAHPDVTWSTFISGWPMEVYAELANRTGADLLMSAFTYFDTANHIASATALFNALDTDRKVYLEWSNELWNSASIFNNQRQWCEFPDEPSAKVFWDGTKFSSNPNSWQTGDYLRCFYSNFVTIDSAQGTFPWYQGGQVRIIEATANSFKCVETEGDYRAVTANANEFGTVDSGSSTTVTDNSKSWTTDQWVGYTVINEDDNDGLRAGYASSVVTSNTSNTLTFSTLTGGPTNTFSGGDLYTLWTPDTPPSAIQTYGLFCKKQPANLSYQRAAEGSATYHVRAWDAWDTVFPRDRIFHLGGSRVANNQSWDNYMLANEQFAAKLDYMAYGPYYGGGGRADGKTDAQFAAEQRAALDSAWSDTGFIGQAISRLENYRYISYECGSSWSDNLTDGGSYTRLLQFMDSTEYYDLTQYYYKLASRWGIHCMTWYISHLPNRDIYQPYSGSRYDLFGSQSYRGSTIDQGYNAIKAMNDDGGPPKL